MFCVPDLALIFYLQDRQTLSLKVLLSFMTGGEGLGRTLGLLWEDPEKCSYFWSCLVGSNRCSGSQKTLVVTTKGEKIIRFRGSALRYCYQYIQNLYYS